MDTHLNSYVNYAQVHNLTQVLISANSKKGYKTKKPESFAAVAPQVNKFISDMDDEEIGKKEAYDEMLSFFNK